MCRDASKQKSDKTIEFLALSLDILLSQGLSLNLKLGWWVECQGGLLVFIPHSLGVTSMCPFLAFPMGSEDLNSGLHTFEASTLTCRAISLAQAGG